MSTLAIELPYDEIAAFCERNQIVRLEVFGSILRDDFGPDSDIDFLYTYAEDSNASLFDFMDHKEELAKIVGRKVDMVSREGLENHYNFLRRDRILGSAEEYYSKHFTPLLGILGAAAPSQSA